MLRGIAAYVRRHHIALLALFFALGGTAVAASNSLLPKNSVGTKQVINGSLAKADLSGKAVKALKGNKGARGIPGAGGPQGPAGPQGVQGVQGVQGIPGPTRGAHGGVSTAFAAGGSAFATAIVNVPSTGALWVSGQTDYALATASTGTFAIGLFVDGTYVPNSRRQQLLGGSYDVNTSGLLSTSALLASVAPGNHTITLRFETAGSVSGVLNDFGVDGIALAGSGAAAPTPASPTTHAFRVG
jgi:hypothetical protein